MTGRLIEKREEIMFRRLPEVLTREEAATLVAAPNTYYPTGRRDVCMLKLMLNAGLRASEVLDLACE